MTVVEVRAMLARMGEADRREVLRMLRTEFGIPIHKIERDWGINAEAILEAIYAAPDLTRRGVRGVLAEAIFRTVVVPRLVGWRSIPFEGDQPYDLLLDGGHGKAPLKVQVKNQRKEQGVPKIDARLSAATGVKIYIVETQRTRNGSRAAGETGTTATRPYRFDEFDVLAVCMQPSSKNWEDFIYCPTGRLLARPRDSSLLKVLQPIYSNETNGWTRDIDDAASDVYAAGGDVS